MTGERFRMDMEVFELLSEEKYEEQMKTVVEPALVSVRQCGRLEVDGEGGAIHWEYYRRAGADTVVISHGFSESCRKYDELAYYLYKEGFQVFVWDQRGHGMSLREGSDANVVHVKRFSDYVDDMFKLMTQVVKPMSGGGRLLLFGHSMGGCVGTLFLEQYPAFFERAVLNAPMLAVDMGKYPLSGAKLLCDVMRLAGKGDEKLFIHGEFDPNEPFAVSCASSECRHLYYLQKRRENPCYRTSAASYSWGSASIGAGRRAMRHISQIHIPVLMMQAGLENQVKNEREEKFVKRAENGQILRFPTARHEAFRSENGVLQTYMKELIFFLKKE